MKIGLPTIISINGVPFPQTPMQFKHTVITADLDSYTDIKGNLNRPNILGDRDRFNFVIPPLESNRYYPVLQQLKKRKIVIVYRDFFDESITRTKNFHTGDLTKEPYWIKSTTNTLWNPFEFQLTSYTVHKRVGD